MVRTFSRRLAATVVASAVGGGTMASAHAQANEPVYGRTDRINDAPVTPLEMNPRLTAAPSFQTWDWWLWTDDGTFVSMQFVVSSFGFGIERQGSVRATAVLPGAVSTGGNEPGIYRARRGFEYARDEWSFSRDRFDVTLQECHMRGDGETFQVAMFDDFLKVELDVTMEAPLWRPGDGRLEYGYDRNIRVDELVFPRFRFTGRMSARRTRQAEESWRPIQGVGYGEHVHINAFPFAVGTAWYGFRALRDDGLTILFDDLKTPDTHGGERLGWVLVLLDGQPIFTSHDVTVVETDVRPDENPPSVYPVPWGYTVVAQNGADQVVIEVGNSALVTRDSILSRVSRLIRAALSGRMNPIDLELQNDYRASLTIDGTTAVVRGAGWSTFNFPR